MNREFSRFPDMNEFKTLKKCLNEIKNADNFPNVLSAFTNYLNESNEENKIKILSKMVHNSKEISEQNKKYFFNILMIS